MRLFYFGIFIAFALVVLTILKNYFLNSPLDTSIGLIPVLSEEDLFKVYENKRVLIIGGTRGVGKGTATAVAKAGAHVTIVGRNLQSGNRALSDLQSIALSSRQKIDFIQGDLGSVAGAMKLVSSLRAHTKQNGLYDYLVLTAAVFPNWNDLLQEDGLDRGFAIMVLGRYIVYRNMDKFLNPKSSRVLNVAIGGMCLGGFNRQLASGEKNVTNLLGALKLMAIGNELMELGLQEKGKLFGLPYVTTHPGLLKTDLHRGQGFLFDLLEIIMVAVMGISENDCGVRQASILASTKLHPGSLSYVDEHMYGRKMPNQLQIEADKHLNWLWSFLNEKANLSS